MLKQLPKRQKHHQQHSQHSLLTVFRLFSKHVHIEWKSHFSLAFACLTLFERFSISTFRHIARDECNLIYCSRHGPAEAKISSTQFTFLLCGDMFVWKFDREIRLTIYYLQPVTRFIRRVFENMFFVKETNPYADWWWFSIDFIVIDHEIKWRKIAQKELIKFAGSKRDREMILSI